MEKFTVMAYKGKSAKERHSLRDGLIVMCGKVSVAQMACLECGVSQALVAEIFMVSRRTIYDNCTSGRYNYPKPGAYLVASVMDLLRNERII